MRCSPLKASLAALALVSAMGVAEAKKTTQHGGVPNVIETTDSAQQISEIRQFLANGKDLSRMKLPRLQQRLHRAENLRSVPDLPPELDQALQQEIARITQEIARREQAGAGTGQPQPEAAQPPAPTPQPPVAAEQPAPAPVPPAAQQAQQPAAAPAILNPALERQAQAYLDDNADVQSMKRRQLRKRLATVRDLLATNQLSPQTREALRQKLARERAVLRNEVAADQGLPPPATPQPPQPQPQGQPQPQAQPPQGQQAGSTGGTPPNNNGRANTDVQVVLQDRRPPSELGDRELVRRIDVYRDVVADDRYSEEQRVMWRQQMEADRRYLRGQMMAERRQREAQLRQGDYQFNHDVQDRYDPRYDVPDDVFAAEADDSELADVLVAPPRRQIQRRYTVDDIERQPQVREAVARIEIDTVHFGFGEGYLREEEIDKLDRIAQVLEKILASHPEEVFLIEGHTDAVGSDQANLVLSRQRAAAVKEALTTYYVIPPESLKTVGLGERYLKIPTNQPEAENRRVSLARITPLLGQAD